MNAHANTRHLVLVDDDTLFLSTLSLNFEDAGYAVEGFPSPRQALTALTERADAPPVDAVILDWQMPEMSGLELLTRLRDAGLTAPALFLTSHDQPMYEEAALDKGAVDFIDKTRSFSIILKRVSLIVDGLKPTGSEDQARIGAIPLTHGALELDRETCRARWRGADVGLTLSEYKVLNLLTDRSGHDVSYRQIYDCVRGEGFIAGAGPEGYRANVRTMIKRIRQKFRALDQEFDCIANYSGFGYRWLPEGGASLGAKSADLDTPGPATPVSPAAKSAGPASSLMLSPALRRA